MILSNRLPYLICAPSCKSCIHEHRVLIREYLHLVGDSWQEVLRNCWVIVTIVCDLIAPVNMALLNIKNCKVHLLGYEERKIVLRVDSQRSQRIVEIHFCGHDSYARLTGMQNIDRG